MKLTKEMLDVKLKQIAQFEEAMRNPNVLGGKQVLNENVKNEF